MLCTASAAARRTSASPSTKLPSGEVASNAVRRFRTSGLSRSRSVEIAARRAARSSSSSAASARPVSIAYFTAASVSVSARWRNNSIVVSSSARIISFTAVSRTDASGFDSANLASAILRNRRRRLLVPIFVRSDVALEPAASSDTGSVSSIAGRLSSAVFTMTTRWSC